MGRFVEGAVISSCFSWSESAEGYEYWSRVNAWTANGPGADGPLLEPKNGTDQFRTQSTETIDKAIKALNAKGPEWDGIVKRLKRIRPQLVGMKAVAKKSANKKLLLEVSMQRP